MAKTNDTTLAQKKRKQMIILAVGGAILLALAALQGPKIFGGGGSSPAPAGEATGTTGTSTPASTGTSTTTGSVPATVAVVAPGAPKTVLVGVTVGGTGATPSDAGQLRMFTLFKSKDPFVQSLPDETTATSASASQPESTATQPTSTTTGTGTTTTTSNGSGTSYVAPTSGELTYATITINGKPQRLEVSDRFPKRGKVFILLSLKPKSAKIALANGTFASGKTITLQLGKNLTLVNKDTGARFSMKLVYTGDVPEQIKGFTTGAAKQK